MIRLPSPARVIALAVHEIVTEYRKLTPAAPPPPPPAQPDQPGRPTVPGRDPESLPGCNTQLSYQDDPHKVRMSGRRPGFGFTADQR